MDLPIPRLTAVTVPEATPVDGQEVDGQEVDEPEVDERAGAEARLRLRRGRVATAMVAGALVVLVGAVALLGGFERRTDLLTPVTAGSVIVTGPYEVTLATATVQRRTSSAEWDVVATGTARTTGTTSIDPPSGDSGFVFARPAAGRETQSSRTITLGDASATEQQDALTPGLPPVPWSVSFRFTSPPGDTVLVAVLGQEYTTPYLFSSEEGWRPTNQASTTTLPLRQLPDTKY